jgi:hypothetical protein
MKREDNKDESGKMKPEGYKQKDERQAMRLE